VSSATLAEADAKFTATITDALKRAPFPGINEPVFHFTDTAGLDSILRTKSLWASLATALEDTSEIAFALSRARHILQADVGCKNPAKEWQLLEAFVGQLAQHFSDQITAINMEFDPKD
jgi:hypothetical protein